MRVLRALDSTVGTKLLLGLTGLALAGFLVFHLAGNLLVFFGPEAYNEHAHALISNPLVVPAEIGLLAIFLLHAIKAVLNFVRNRAARPRRYAAGKKWSRGPSRKTISSTTMIVSGVITFAFVILHLKTFKYGPYYATGTADVRDLYRLLVEVFHSPFYVVFYVACMILVGMHLRHGISSALQSLGLVPAGWTRAFLAACLVLALAVGVGFAIIPVWVYVAL